MLRKKGQTEDIFSDLIPALIILAIGIFVAVNIGDAQKKEIAKLTEQGQVVDRILPLTVLRAPFDMPKARTLGHKGSFLDFIHHLSDTKIKEETYKNIVTKQTRVYTSEIRKQDVIERYYECESELWRYLNENLLGKYETWILRIYQEQYKKDDIPTLLFLCTSQFYDFEPLTDNIRKKPECFCDEGCFGKESKRTKSTYFASQLGTKHGSSLEFKELYGTTLRLPSKKDGEGYRVILDYAKDHCVRRS